MAQLYKASEGKNACAISKDLLYFKRTFYTDLAERCQINNIRICGSDARSSKNKTGSNQPLVLHKYRPSID